MTQLRAQDLVNEALTEVSGLSRDLLNLIQDELDANAQHFGLREAWRRVRPRFAAEFETRLLAALQEALHGGDPLQRTSPTLGGLSLVDESQALEDVAVAHVVHAAEDIAKPELYQIGNFFAALKGGGKARERDNPLRPAIYAQALHQAIAASGVNAQVHHDLMRAAATPVARRLAKFYGGVCERLRAAQLTDLVAGFGSGARDSFAHQRLAAARGVGALNSSRGTLDGLARRVDAVNSRPAPFDAHVGAQAAPLVRSTGPDMLSRLYDQILADPRLLPPLKGLLARLQVAVVRMARADPSLLRRHDHPTWDLLNRVAAHGMTFDRADDPALQAFLRFMEAEAKLLTDAPVPSVGLFELALRRVNAEIESQTHQAEQRHAEAIQALARGEERAEWTAVVREQILQQTSRAPLSTRCRHFLETAWVDVIVHAMAEHGHDSAAAQMAMDAVDALLESFKPPRDAIARAALQQRLPRLIHQLEAGCDSIQLAAPRRDAFFQDLMDMHGRVLRGLPAVEVVAKPPPTPEEIVQQLMEERDSRPPTHWLTTRVDRGELPTVPVALYSGGDREAARSAIEAWFGGVHIGRWFHLFTQGEWHTVQLAWISPSSQSYFFVGRDLDERLPLTRKALEALLANGLITALEEESVVQRAVDTLMSDLPEA
ncbi:DUF1631 family protein [Roseateles paludis]|jgi:hypothetical protein|uniref:DUF1631 family protein n=1 Tax=Roseateles paludis TaxID=3145238 RepID=A0ABV0G2G8_9BURK